MEITETIFDVRTKTETQVKKEYEQPQEELNQIRIIELKQLLANTDYKAIKYAEGLISAEDYAETKAQRQKWREEINNLEGGGNE